MSAEYVTGYRLRLTFSDGVVGELDLESELWGETFEPVRDPEYFQKFEVHSELNTLTWSNGADLAPEHLYKAVAA